MRERRQRFPRNLTRSASREKSPRPVELRDLDDRGPQDSDRIVSLTD